MENEQKKAQKEQKEHDYKERISEMIEGIESVGILKYLCRFIELYLEKWG